LIQAGRDATKCSDFTAARERSEDGRSWERDFDLISDLLT
jgi:hypothetical protein